MNGFHSNSMLWKPFIKLLLSTLLLIDFNTLAHVVTISIIGYIVGTIGRSPKPTAVGYAAQLPRPPPPNSSSYRGHNATYIGEGFGKYFLCEDKTQRLYCGKVHCKLLVTL